MAIYTRTGDAGSTSLFTGQRVSKTHPRVEAYGTLDELNAMLSLCVCAVAEEEQRTLLEALQQHIFWFSAELASDSEQPSPGKRYISSEEIALLEQTIDREMARVPALHQFVLPGRCEAASRLHLARTVARRAERRLVELGAEVTIRQMLLRYLNLNAQGEISATHLAGAGDMVTMIIARELGLEDRYLAEEIKKYPLAKVESLFHLRHEDGSVQFFPSALPPTVFARVCVVKPDELVPLPGDLPLEKVRAIRRSAKSRVFITNALRALRQVSPTGNIRDIPFVVLVGGSSLDFEIPQLVTDALAHYRLVAGRGNIRGCEGPRNAVASGLLLSWQKGGTHGE